MTASAGPPAPRITLQLATGPREVSLELATTPEAREKGLMFRKQLGSDVGMLFVFPDEAPRQFWMRNTYIPLDMIFINGAGLVVGVVERAEPLTTTPRGVAAAAKYVLEVNGGYVQRYGVTAGARVSLESGPLTVR